MLSEAEKSPNPMTSQTCQTSPILIVVRNFTSQWFLIPQGTGIIALILHQLDYQFTGLGIIADIFWVLTIVMLVSTITVYLLRTAMYPREVASAISSDVSESSCLSCIAITFTSIIQMIAVTVVREWGSGWGIVAYVLWWINTAMTVLVCIGLPYIFVMYEPPGLQDLTPATQLPLIAALTSAAGGGVICRYGALSYRLQVPIILVSYLLIGVAIPLALSLDTVFLTRLLNKSAPTKDGVYQEMILCGPWGQGSFALQVLGQVVMRGSFAGYAKGIFLTANAAQPVGYTSIFAGLLAWGQGSFWWAFAIISITHAAIGKPGGLRAMKFGLLNWSLVFPWVC
jgi:tellurite resistance protein TehA-like permease